MPSLPLPVVTKTQLMAHFDTAVTDPEVTRAALRRFLADPSSVGHRSRRYAVWTTSGTTGEPGIFVHDGEALAVYDALEAHPLPPAGVACDARCGVSGQRPLRSGGRDRRSLRR